MKRISPTRKNSPTRLPSQVRILVIVAVCASCLTGQATTLVVHYPQSTTLFASAYDATAKAAIDAAAADLSAAITTSLSPITTTTYTGISGPSRVTLDWIYYNVNPQTGLEALTPATIAANEVRIAVGARSLPFGQLGNAGLAGAGFTASGTAGSFQQTQEAVGNAAAASQAAYRRGNGPRIVTFYSAVAGHPFSVDFGVAYGHVAFNNDINGNGLPNTATQLNNYWHWNHTTPVAPGKFDLYSVALHEMMHVLGIGASDSWRSHMSGGTNWTGPEVLAITGSGTNLVDGGHIADGTVSYRISDGLPQTVVMDHSLVAGQRKSLTVLDLAFLRDIGWETITPELPSSSADFNDDSLVNGVDLGIWQNAFAVTAAGDADGDGITDGRDFLIWQRDYTGSLPLAASLAVPEPSSVALITLALAIACFSRRRGNAGSS